MSSNPHQSGRVTPNLDQQSTKVLNLTVLQRIDPYIEEILITAAHVAFYGFNIDLNQWVCHSFAFLPLFIISVCVCVWFDCIRSSVIFYSFGLGF